MISMKNTAYALSTLVLFSFSICFPQMLAAAEVNDAAALIPAQNALAQVPIPDFSAPAASEDESLKDHQASIFEVNGDVKLLKRDKEEWGKAEKGMLLEEGDKIITGSQSYVDIAYDKSFLNIVRIEEKTKGEFRSIEPTDLFLEDGAIFSVLDGLAGSQYQISTPTAVAGVRGTTFNVEYEAQSGNFEANVFPDKSEHVGEIVLEYEGDKKIILTEGQAFENGQMGEIPPARLEEAKKIMGYIENRFGAERQEGLGVLDELHTEGKKDEGDGNNAPDETALLEDSLDDNKVGQNPNDGGDGGADGDFLKDGGDAKGEFQQILPQFEGDVDSLVDDVLATHEAVNDIVPFLPEVQSPDGTFKNFDPDKMGMEEPQGEIAAQFDDTSHKPLPAFSGTEVGNDFEMPPFDPAGINGFGGEGGGGNFYGGSGAGGTVFQPDIKDQIINNSSSNSSNSGPDYTGSNCTSPGGCPPV